MAARKNPRGTLTADRIIGECLALLDQEGAAGLTFRRIGAKLDADPTAVYRHFRNKDELILALMDHMITQGLEGFAPHDDWRETLKDLAWRTRRVYLAHPHAAVLGTIRVTRREGEMRIVEIILSTLADAGFDDEEAARLYRVLDDLTLAFAGLDAGFRVLDAEQQAKDEGAWSKEYAAADPATYPYIARSAGHLAAIDEDSTFGLALDLTIDAIAARAPSRADVKRPASG